MKYPSKFERDFKWYLSMRHIYDFDGSLNYTNKQGEWLIQYDKAGVSGKEAFYSYDSFGVILKTKHPNLLLCLLKTKGSTNFHIKMYVEGRLDGTLSYQNLLDICVEFNTPDWFFKAVEEQKNREYIKQGIPVEWLLYIDKTRRDEVIRNTNTYR